MTSKEMFEKNINIAYRLTQQYKDCGVEIDDLRQICLFALWKAAKTYDKEKGASFTTYSYRVIKNECNYYLRKNRKYFTNRSLSENIMDRVTIEDTIADEYDAIEELENRMDDEKRLKSINTRRLNEKEKMTLNLYCRGYRQEEIARITKCTQPQVSRRLRRIRKILKPKEQNDG